MSKSKFYGVSGLGNKTARGYPTPEEALAAIERKEKRHFSRIKLSGPLPQLRTIKKGEE